jgi:hypothetical protein
MLDWIRRVFGQFTGDERRLIGTANAVDDIADWGKPVRTTMPLGRLRIPSGTLALGDPQYVPDIEIPNIAADEVAISASFWHYPSGEETVIALRLDLGEPREGGLRRKLGEVGIDSAKLVVADKADLEEYWTETRNDRIGVISTAPDDRLLRLLTKRFKLKTVRISAVRAEVVGPVSEQLAAEIEAFLKSDPRYANYPFVHFGVQTNNSFERANHMARAWGFMPIGNADSPSMFVCVTGGGDGVYAVECQFSGDAPSVLSIKFLED